MAETTLYTLIEALNKLRKDIQLWAANNFRTKLDKNLGTDESGKYLKVDDNGDIITAEANYTLPAATTSTLGGVMIGSNINVSSGVINLTNANVTGALGYTPLHVTNDSENSQAKVNIDITEPYSFHLSITNNTGTTPHSCSIFQGSTNDDNRGIGIYDARNNKVGWVYNDSNQSLAINVPASFSDNVVFNNGKGIKGKDADGTAQYLMFLSASNTLNFGYDMPSTSAIRFNIPIIGTLHLSNLTDASSTADNDAALIIGSRTGEHLVFDRNEIIPKNGANAGGTLYLGDSENTVISISGKFRVNSYSYGTSLPAAGTAGRVFFKKV